jgi:ribosomal protein S18 acetylase RimI-like enzyme
MAAAEETSIIVRSATPSDRATVPSFISMETARGRASLVLLRTGQGMLWVAVEGKVSGADEKLVGLLLATVQIDMEREEAIGYIHELLVHPAYRRLGVAHHLLDAAERYCLEQQGLSRIELATSPDNEAALHLYRSRGYVFSQVRLAKQRLEAAPSDA